jgi:hypothetical protein
MKIPSTPRFRMTSVFYAALALAAAAGSASAQQNVSFLRTGSIEAGVFGGASYGIVSYQGMVGGNVTIAANKWILPYVEYTYLPQVAFPLAPSLSVPAGYTVAVNHNISFSDFHGGVHIRLPIHDSPVVPYLAVGVGVLTHFSQDVTFTTTPPAGSGFGSTSQTITVPTGSNFAVNAGGGIRYYLASERFGFRAEAKVYKPTGQTYNSTFGKVEFGIFYQFR